jgi:hypothetical protein
MEITYFTRDLPFDVTFLDREPILEVRLKTGCARLVYRSSLRRGNQTSEKDIERAHIFRRHNSFFLLDLGHPSNAGYRVYYHRSDNTDMQQAEIPAGANGETIREMARRMYRGKTEAKEDYLLRRFIVS